MPLLRTRDLNSICVMSYDLLCFGQEVRSLENGMSGVFILLARTTLPPLYEIIGNNNMIINNVISR